MNKLKLWPSKISSVTVFSLVFVILGIGCICWATFNIWSQSNYSVKVTPIHHSIHTTAKTIATATTKTLYPVYPKDGDNIGSLTIPSLNQILPIIQGTGEKELKKGVGHFSQSVLPGEKDNCVFSGHRDTVFRQIGNLKIGDKLIVQTSAGVFTYKVNGTRIVHENDKTVIVPTPNAVLNANHLLSL